jgi:hypothetical protein
MPRIESIRTEERDGRSWEVTVYEPQKIRPKRPNMRAKRKVGGNVGGGRPQGAA